MAKQNDPVSLAGEFVRCPTALLTDDKVTPAHRNLWLLLEAHCITEPSCFPSIARLAKLLGLSGRWVKTLLIDLEEKGYLTRNFRAGKCTIYRPRIPVNPGSTLHPPDQTQEVHFTPPVNCSSPHPGSTLHPETEELNQKNFKQGNRPKDEDPKPEKMRAKGKKGTNSVTRESVEAQIDALDLAKFRTQYLGLNIDDEYESFRDHFLAKNDPKSGKPNWLKWSDWNRSFHNWLKNARKFAAERGPATKTPEPPRQTQRLRDVTY